MKIYVDKVEITDKNTNMKKIRQKVGLVFQYPEHQLFEETIYKDISFGPINLELEKSEVDKRVRDSMKAVGLDFDEYKDRSPFELSGGQKRRVAIAGVLAMEPEVLILDEPTAGLDPRGRDEIFFQLRELIKANKKLTIILVSHSMEDICELVEDIIVMNNGQIALTGPPNEIFKDREKIESYGLAIPQVTSFMKKLKEKYPSIDENIYRLEDAREEIIKKIKEG